MIRYEDRCLGLSLENNSIWLVSTDDTRKHTIYSNTANELAIRAKYSSKTLATRDHSLIYITARHRFISL